MNERKDAVFKEKTGIYVIGYFHTSRLSAVHGTTSLSQITIDVYGRFHMHASTRAVHDFAPSTAAVVITAPIWNRHGVAPSTAKNVYRCLWTSSHVSTFRRLNWTSDSLCRRASAAILDFFS